MNVRALVAEAVGTFILILFGSLGVASMAVITNGQGDPVAAIWIIPWAFGLGLLAAIAVAGHVSGGHFNPAVTLAALFDERIDWKNALAYVVAQIVGGLAASLVMVLVTSADVVALSVNTPTSAFSDGLNPEVKAFAVEALLTAVFVAVILTVTVKAPAQAVLVIPLTLICIHFVGALVSGASVNPVRSLAPAVVSGTYDSLWVYLTGPFVGAILGWAIFRFLTPAGADEEGAADDGDDDEDDEDEDDDAAHEFYELVEDEDK